MSRPDRIWMYSSRSSNIKEYLVGLQEFLVFANNQVAYKDGENIRCPCVKCALRKYIPSARCESHLIAYGFMQKYETWTAHGESIPDAPIFNYPKPRPSRAQQHNFNSNIGEIANPFEGMVYDMGANYNVNLPEINGEPSSVSGRHMLDERFWNALNAAKMPIWDGHETENKLSATVRLLNLKSENNWSDRAMDENLDLIRSLLPMDNTLPESFYNMKKLVEDLGLPVIRIDSCRAGCMLFWREDNEHLICKFCSRERYKVRGDKRKPYQQLFYLPLAPRLQRLYASKKTAHEMTWHARHCPEKGFMCHPSDGEAWKTFDIRYQDFAKEHRNVRLGLCSDGFAPFGQYGRPYSCWPVILTPYNLPPGMCMKPQYMFISLIVPGPKSPKKNLDIYLQPLIHELQMLWSEGVPTYDVDSGETFNMRAMLLWTISDFPAYGMLSGWSTHGLYGCPVCMGNSRCFRLKHGMKPSYFDAHRRFLPSDHPYRIDIQSFTKDRIETFGPPRRLEGFEIWDEISPFSYAHEDPLGNPPGFGVCHKWTKKSIFWQLPYWGALLLRHNLDFMHIEKNVFENIIHTIMNVKGKTKDNIKARKDMFLICDRPSLSIHPSLPNSKMRKAQYTFSRDDNQLLCEWLKGLKFPDGYASNLARCVDRSDSKLVALKSHDCHIFLQRLMPIAFKHLLPKEVWRTLCHLSNFMNELSSTTLSVCRLGQLEEEIIVILCNLEQIFPPSFFDVMEHLLIHLPYEARIGGPVQYRWMYPFERFLQSVKKKVKNKARVEASICNAYILEEISTFASHYFQCNVRCKQRLPPRNSEGPQNPNFPPVSIFNYPGRNSGATRKRYLDSDETLVAHTYVLLNCPEVDPYYTEFCGMNDGVPALENDQRFAAWFRDKIVYERAQGEFWPAEKELLYYISFGPKTPATTFSLYFVNGYVWRPKDYLSNKETMNSGVCVVARDATYYGLVEEIIELQYPGPRTHVVLFKCLWFDPVKGTRVDTSTRVVEVNMKKKYTRNDPFILSQQGRQVTYAAYPNRTTKHGDWIHVCITKARGKIEERWTNDNFVYQQEIPINGIYINLPMNVPLYSVDNWLNIPDEELDSVEGDEEASEHGEDDESPISNEDIINSEDDVEYDQEN